MVTRVWSYSTSHWHECDVVLRTAICSWARSNDNKLLYHIQEDVFPEEVKLEKLLMYLGNFGQNYSSNFNSLLGIYSCFPESLLHLHFSRNAVSVLSVLNHENRLYINYCSCIFRTNMFPFSCW